MATVEIHGSTTFILVICLILSVSSISQLHPPTPKTKFVAAPSGGFAGCLCDQGPCSVDRVGHAGGAGGLGLSSVL